MSGSSDTINGLELNALFRNVGEEPINLKNFVGHKNYWQVIGYSALTLSMVFAFQNCGQFRTEGVSTVPVSYSGPGSVSAGSVTTLYDTTVNPPACQIFLDQQIFPISFSNPDGTFNLVFSNVDFRGHNYHLTAKVSNGSIAQVSTTCNSILTSALDSKYQNETGAEWLGALYKISNSEIYALIHNEFYGGNFPQSGMAFPADSSCPSGSPLTCTYSSVTGAVSTDGGVTFTRQGSPPTHSVAKPSFPYSSSQTNVTGYFINTNIVKAGDGYYYMLLTDYNSSSVLSVCPARTPSLSNPSLWRAWDGSAYRANSPSGAECAPISIGISPFYLAYSTYFGGYLAVGTANTSPFHVSYATSQDLIHWSELVDLGVAPSWAPGAGSTTGWGNYNYPSLIDLSKLQQTTDPNSSSNAQVGQSPLLLFIDRKGDNSGTRILALPLQFSR